MPPAQQIVNGREDHNKIRCQHHHHHRKDQRLQDYQYYHLSNDQKVVPPDQSNHEYQLYQPLSLHTTKRTKTKLALTRNLFTFDTIAYIALVILTICSFCRGSPCHSDNWWDANQDKCIQCTKCKDHLIAIRPCLIYQDRVCGTIEDLNIDWRPLTRTEPNWKERRKGKQQIEEMVFDWQAASLVLAAIACLIFFLAAAYISIQHMRQWRRMERRLDRDVEELSTKLMQKLAEVQNVENGGSFLIENPIKGQNVRPVEVHCVYLEKLLAGKEAQRAASSRGNFYIEGNGSKG